MKRHLLSWELFKLFVDHSIVVCMCMCMCVYYLLHYYCNMEVGFALFLEQQPIGAAAAAAAGDNEI